MRGQMERDKNIAAGSESGSSSQPVKARIIRKSDVEIRRRNQHDAGGWVESPAQFTFTGLGAGRLRGLAGDVGLGTERPTSALVVPGQGNHKLYWAPVAEHPDALEVKWYQNRASVNLVLLFTSLKRLVPAGGREFYPFEDELAKVEVEGVVYDALVMPLKRTETRWEKSEKAKEEAKAKAEAKKASRKPSSPKPAAPGTDPGAQA
jgi:hypothetical protein